jgi:hypothetical protein
VVTAIALAAVLGLIGYPFDAPQTWLLWLALLLCAVLLYGLVRIGISRPVRAFAHRCRIVFAVVGVIAAMGGAYAWFFWTPLGSLVLTREYQGIIMRVHSVSGQPWSNAWDVARSDIREFESGLSAHVRSHVDAFGDFIPAHLPEYRRRYHGFEEGGRRFIAATFEHPEFTSRHTWLRKVYWTAGGGYFIWYITYDVESGHFTNFWMNAPI